MKLYNSICFLIAVVLLTLAGHVKSEELTFSILRNLGVPNSTEHYADPYVTEYNEDNKIQNWSVEVPVKYLNHVEYTQQYVYVNYGDMNNSFYTPTETHGIGIKNCLGHYLYYCFGAGIMGARGYTELPDMFEDFFYLPELNHSFKVIYKALQAEYKEQWIPTALVKTEIFSVGVNVSFDLK